MKPQTTCWLGGLLFVLLCCATVATGAQESTSPSPPSDLVKQATAPISSILQFRLQDSYVPQFTGASGQANTLTASLTMPLPRYRLLPVPQLSLFTMPVAATVPGNVTGIGDLRFLDIAILDAGQEVLWGVGPVFVFPTASLRAAGQGKWQVGPAAAIAYAPKRWLLGVLAQNPISFAGDQSRSNVNTLVLQPFVTYQFGQGWFLRSQPQMVFDWKNGKQILPIDLGAGRVFALGRQQMSCFVEGFWNLSRDKLQPSYGFTVGVSLLYPGFWERFNRQPEAEREGPGNGRSGAE